MDDFWSIDLNQEKAVWERVAVKGKARPGPKTRHSNVVYNDKLYLFGGQHTSMLSSRDIWCFDFKSKTWTLEVPRKQDVLPPSIDSHSCILIGSKMYIFFGYSIDAGALSNAVYEYDFSKSVWKLLSKGTPKSEGMNLPCPRFESAVTQMASIPNKLFLFGGSDGFARFNDLWTFDLTNNSYQEIQSKADTEIPMIRSGHSLVGDKDKLILFGGIHDITWELNDMWVFDMNSKTWTILDQDTGRQRDYSPVKSTQTSPYSSGLKLFKGRSTKRGKTMSSISPTRTLTFSPKKMTGQNQFKSFSNIDEGETESGSKIISQSGFGGVSIIEEKKRKDFLANKAQMLSVFTVDEVKLGKQQLQSFRDSSPVSEAMKNSIINVGNPMPSLKQKEGKLSEFGCVTVSRFLEPLSTQDKYRKGKRPCARDGHRMVSDSGNKMIIFGGDRHNMSFNDIFILDLSILSSQLQQGKQM